MAYERYSALDSLPIPVGQFYLAPGVSREWATYGASFGKAITKKQTIFGYKLHAFISLGGVILDFILAPAHQTNVWVGKGLLLDHHDRIVLGDKEYISAELVQTVAANGIVLLTIPRQNQKQQLPAGVAHCLNTQCKSLRWSMDNSLSSSILPTIRSIAFGICARLFTKLAAHMLSIYLNQLLGKANFLQIKQLAFPS